MPSSPHMQDRVVAWTQHVRHVGALRRVLQAFDVAGVPALPVKGAISAHIFYPDIAHRLLTDIDLKIRESDFDRVLAIGRQHGWRPVQRMRAYGNVVFLVEGVCIDIECFVSAPWLSRLTVAQMLARAAPSSLLGFPHLLADFDDHAVVLLLNVFKDKLVHAFVWAVRDVELLPSCREFDARRLAVRLREVGAKTIGWIVADWMVRERGVAAWQAVRDELGGESPERVRYVALLGRLREMQPRGALALRVLARAGADYRSDRLRALARMIWWQAEAWASRYGDMPLRRKDVASVEGTVFAARRDSK